MSLENRFKEMVEVLKDEIGLQIIYINQNEIEGCLAQDVPLLRLSLITDKRNISVTFHTSSLVVNAILCFSRLIVMFEDLDLLDGYYVDKNNKLLHGQEAEVASFNELEANILTSNNNNKLVPEKIEFVDENTKMFNDAFKKLGDFIQ